MNGLGRFLALGALSGDAARRHAESEWRALHRRPDVPPLADDMIAPAADDRHREDEPVRLHRLAARLVRR